MKAITIKIKQFKELFELREIPFLWRGQSNAEWTLQTSIERQIDKTSCTPLIESTILREFKRKQHLYENSKDIVNNDFECIAKIQHHGGPTRLLDFTNSLFIASYFCFEDFDNKNDGAIWGINSLKYIRIDPDLEVEKMMQELIYGKTSDLFSTYIGGRNKKKKVIFIEPYILNHRLHV
ncbi:FRG domain-containing protein [Myroides sp. JBRI-B21084]|uniref:FRG domain-containing protein n=1 Tax=Myroides sp. JBRI-B21084 TaxID=3119977 RepID=UPI0026E47AAD|nr:FRG domain-containing protein [Paenimyroides cloacae]WKW47611.1 FRG domain-containing protein [Paenimyroides cloacae]